MGTVYSRDMHRVKIDSNYNGRTPTVPTNTRNAAVTFNACQRYVDDSIHDRGFVFLYHFDCKLFVLIIFCFGKNVLTLSPLYLKLSFGTTFIFNIILAFRKQITE